MTGLCTVFELDGAKLLCGTLNDIPTAEYKAAYGHQTETNQPVVIQ